MEGALKERISILGAGQLAQMLAVKAMDLGYGVKVLAQSEHEPALQVGAEGVIAPKPTLEKLREFLSQCEVVIFENEFVDTDLLERAAQGLPVRFQPGLPVLAFLQDKLLQKKLCRSLGLGTAPFLDVVLMLGNATDLKTVEWWLKELMDRFPKGAVLKWARGGYDGKGVLVVHGLADLDKVVVFLRAAQEKGYRVFAEAKVDFIAELAVVGVRGGNGEWISYPLVLTEQTKGTCLWVKGPATAWGIAAEIQDRAQAWARTLAEASGAVGALAVEFFLTAEGDLYVNEIAPRVHNSGHYTQDAAQTSQFENHCRAALGLPLGPVECASYFGMLNLLGPEGLSTLKDLDPRAAGLWDRRSPEVHLHWYGKKGSSPRRKLGHVNFWSGTKEGWMELKERVWTQAENWSREQGKERVANEKGN